MFQLLVLVFFFLTFAPLTVVSLSLVSRAIEILQVMLYELSKRVTTLFYLSKGLSLVNSKNETTACLTNSATHATLLQFVNRIQR